MRRTLNICGYILLSLFTVDGIIAVADWSARVQWVKDMLDHHSSLAGLVRTPIFMFVLLVAGFFLLWSERKLKLPRIKARFMNCQLVPRLRTISANALFDAQQEKPGWDLHKGTWDYFIEILATNESESPTTIEGVKVELRKARKFMGLRLPGWLPRKTVFSCRNLGDFTEHCIHRSSLEFFNDDPEVRLGSLLQEIKGVPLTLGVGHRGWLRFEVPKITQRDLKGSEIDIWLIDALEQEHHVTCKRGAEKNWDKSFKIIESRH